MITEFSSKDMEENQYRIAGESTAEGVSHCVLNERGGSANNKKSQTKMMSYAAYIVPPAERQIDLLSLHFGNIYCAGCISRE